MALTRLAALVAATFIGGAATAATVSSTGAFLVMGTPPTVDNDTPGSNTNILYFNELQNVALTSDIMTDQGKLLTAGTRVNSHMFFLNRSDDDGTLVQLAGTLTLDGNIYGTFSDQNGNLRLQPTDYLGAGTAYTNFNNRGLELTGRYADVVTFSGATVTANMLNVTQPGDWVRVVSAVPIPAALPLMLLGLGGLGFVARRKKQKAA